MYHCQDVSRRLRQRCLLGNLGESVTKKVVQAHLSNDTTAWSIEDLIWLMIVKTIIKAAVCFQWNVKNARTLLNIAKMKIIRVYMWFKHEGDIKDSFISFLLIKITDTDLYNKTRITRSKVIGGLSVWKNVFPRHSCKTRKQFRLRSLC